MSRLRKSLLVTLLKRFDFILGVVFGGLLLAVVYYVLLIQTTNIHTLLLNLEYEPIYKVILLALVPITLLLFGLNLSLTIFLIRAKSGTSTYGTTLFGALLGGFGAACPACGAFLLSLLGVTAGLTAFPLGGLEFWLISIFIMGYTCVSSFKKLDKDTCELDGGNEVCWILPTQSNKLNILLLILTFLLSAYFWQLLYENDYKRYVSQTYIIKGQQCVLT